MSMMTGPNMLNDEDFKFNFQNIILQITVESFKIVREVIVETN